jgi:hypothetical protein
MHNAWLRQVGAYLGTSCQYSASLVYNTFPWPASPNGDAPTEKKKEAIEKAAQAVLDVREEFPKTSLAVLYNPLTMPPKLAKAHQKLDKAVEAAYGKSFSNDADRVAHLFYLYETLNNTLHAPLVKKARKSNK